MSLVPVTDGAAVAAAFAAIRERLRAGATEFPAAEIGWPGGAKKLPLCWRRTERFWVHAGADSGRHLLLFGTEHPRKTARLSITCEINAPANGAGRRYAGAILQDVRGHAYLAHSGRIGGTGGGLATFRACFTGANWQPVLWPTGTIGEMHVIGRIERPRVITQIAYFVHEVARIKHGLRQGGVGDALIAEPHFRPEFARAKRPPRRADPMEAACDRGLVAAALFDALSARVDRVECAGPCLLARERGGRVRAAFAVAMDRSAAALRALAGDLMLCAGAKSSPKRFAVMPAPIGHDARATFAAAGAAVVSYAWSQGWPVFELPADFG